MQYQYRINGKATGMWTPVRMSIGIGDDATEAKDILEGAPRFAFWVFINEPWGQEIPGQEIEWVSGLSHGRNF